MTEFLSPSISVTSTPSGSSTRASAMMEMRSLNAIALPRFSLALRGGARLLLEQSIEPVAELRPLFRPVVEPAAVDCQGPRRIERPDVLDEAPVAGAALLGDDHAV